MFSLLQPRRRYAAANGRCSLAARVMLVLLVWSGPVPVVHDHAALASSVVGSQRFAEHWMRFHVGRAFLTEGCRGCHVHWVLPGEEESGLAGGSNRGAIDRGAPGSSQLVALSNAALTVPHSLDLFRLPTALFSAACQSTSSDSQPYFLCAFGGGLSLPERLGILRC